MVDTSERRREGGEAGEAGDVPARGLYDGHLNHVVTNNLLTPINNL